MFRTCSGLILTSYNRIDSDSSFKETLYLAINEYNHHKNMFQWDEEFKGYIIIMLDLFKGVLKIFRS